MAKYAPGGADSARPVPPLPPRLKAQAQLRSDLIDKITAAALDKAEAQRALAAADLKIAKLKEELDALDAVEGRDA